MTDEEIYTQDALRGYEIEQLKAENARLRGIVKWADEHIVHENERLRAALKRYGNHDYTCPVAAGAAPERCECGLTRALEGK